MTIGVRFAAWAAACGAVAVLLAGVVALAAVDRSLRRVVDDRLDASLSRVTRAANVETACAAVRELGAAEASRRSASLLSRAGIELCRSEPVAPSPRALGVTAAAAGSAVLHRTVEVDGRRWRVATAPHRSGGTVAVADIADVSEAARAEARRAIYVAMGLGVVVAVVGGILAAVPARRRIALLLERIARAGRDPGRRAVVGRVGGRDLDEAARSFDELLEDLRATDAAQRRLLADAAHQLRTPMTSIRTNAQLLERSTGLDDDARELATRIARQSAAVSRLVAGLVDHAAVSAWSAGDRGRVVLADLAEEALHHARERWPGASFELVADDSSRAIDEELLLRAIGNLLDNAVVHGAGTVHVTVADGAVRVQDEGPGFTPELAEVALQPFATGGATGGSGLGLAFVDHVARAHGGRAVVRAGAGGGVAIELPDE